MIRLSCQQLAADSKRNVFITSFLHITPWVSHLYIPVFTSHSILWCYKNHRCFTDHSSVAPPVKGLIWDGWVTPSVYVANSWTLICCHNQKRGLEMGFFLSNKIKTTENRITFHMSGKIQHFGNMQTATGKRIIFFQVWTFSKLTSKLQLWYVLEVANDKAKSLSRIKCYFYHFFTFYNLLLSNHFPRFTWEMSFSVTILPPWGFPSAKQKQFF